MSYEKSLAAEINAELDRLAARGERWNAAWITHAICENHKQELGQDAHFWRFCGYEKTRDTVRRIINSRAGNKPSKAEEQMKLPGYDHLQQYYMVRRDEEDIGVPIHSMTDEEIEAKAVLYDNMAKACHAHAKELRRYAAVRAHEAAA